MGYTHYFTHSKRFTNAEWANVRRDVLAILGAATGDGVEFGDGMGEKHLDALPDAFTDHGDGSGPCLWINGVGEDSHETFVIYQNRRPLGDWQKPSRRGWDFCKTARKPYDVAVSAILAYLESMHPEKFSASSDGSPDDWQAGIDLARAALPGFAEFIQIPQDIEFDALFSRYLFRGGKYALAELTTGELCLIDESAHSIEYQFNPDGAEWAQEWLARVTDERQRKLPAQCDALDRWHAHKMRRLVEAAPVMGYAESAA